MDTKSYAFLHTNIVPMDEEGVISDQTVVIQNGCITQIGNVDHISTAQPLRWPQPADDDLNFEEILFPYLANGITTIQVMSALQEWQIFIIKIYQNLCNIWPLPLTKIRTLMPPKDCRKPVMDL